MKYVMFIWFLAVYGDGKDPVDYHPTQFEIEFDSRDACEAALVETERQLMAREGARATTLQCRPGHVLDEPYTSLTEFYGDDRVAQQ